MVFQAMYVRDNVGEEGGEKQSHLVEFMVV